MVCVGRLKDDPLFGVDSRWSWITAFFCAWVLFLGMATPRIAGIFFYGIVETFGVTRAEASWPVSLAGTFTVMGGPIVGYLCQRFSCRAVLLVCSSLAGIGASLCFLAKSLLFITISFGFVHGGALCGLFVSCNVLVAQHFEKRRATATSLVFTVFGINSVVISPLLEFFRTTYGVRGAFLLYGAILLNAVPAVIILRSPLWLTKQKTRRVPKCEEEDEGNVSCVLIESANADADVSSGMDKENESQRSNQISNCDQLSPSSVKHKNSISHIEQFSRKNSVTLMEAKKVLLPFSLPKMARQFLTLSFLVHALSYAAVVFTVGVFVLIPADLASDRGLNPSNVVYFLQAFSAADIAFRSVVGIAIDSRTLSYESIMLLGFAVQGLTYEWLVWANTLPQMITASAFVGATYGSRSCLLAPALVKDFGIGTLPVIMGGVFFCTGVSLLLRPPLIGHYRDTYGDYTGLLHLMAALNAFFVCIWTLKLVDKRRSKNTASLPPTTLKQNSISKNSSD
ncbi:monocarboxylate transporter 12-like isoform X1 [Dermacentor andersoni]|uniref:monocarboxylate transporter 12-like isoform X1 n=1 Tax=Dermacentor andersoni TaxID=34620 RepID=UPI002417291E|nr:monocarboxylate transporter 2-like [Dermacentor andersoni]